jgi:hypothetical protein
VRIHVRTPSGGQCVRNWPNGLGARYETGLGAGRPIVPIVRRPRAAGSLALLTVVDNLLICSYQSYSARRSESSSLWHGIQFIGRAGGVKPMICYSNLT